MHDQQILPSSKLSHDISCLDVSSDERFLVCGTISHDYPRSGNSNVYLIDVQTKKLVQHLCTCEKSVKAVSFSFDRRFVGISTSDNRFIVLEIDYSDNSSRVIGTVQSREAIELIQWVYSDDNRFDASQSVWTIINGVPTKIELIYSRSLLSHELVVKPSQLASSGIHRQYISGVVDGNGNLYSGTASGDVIVITYDGVFRGIIPVSILGINSLFLLPNSLLVALATDHIFVIDLTVHDFPKTLSIDLEMDCLCMAKYSEGAIVSSKFGHILIVNFSSKSFAIHSNAFNSDVLDVSTSSSFSSSFTTVEAGGLTKIWSLEDYSIGAVSRPLHDAVMVAAKPMSVAMGTEHVVTGWSAGSVNILKVESQHLQPGKRLKIQHIDPTYVLRHSNSDVVCCAISEDQKIFATADKEGFVSVWNLLSGQSYGVLKAHNKKVTGLKVHTISERVINASSNPFVSSNETVQKDSSIFYHVVHSVGQDGTLSSWFATKDQQPLINLGHSTPFSSLDVFSDDQVISGDETGHIIFWDIKYRRGDPCLKICDEALTCVKLSPNKQFLAMGDRSGCLYILKLEDNSLIAKVEAHKKEIRSISWTIDGRQLISSAEEGAIFIWNCFF
eukprot:TRINITY_DN1397_c0_g1_i1.p1 TRINITY_DN1397_c0_g1~~TRINITY_DN1397_c0_g1_i1.p1  ORF type:complete len:655 (+),score=180.32 TRINITY_DN1397_c0_g1_i1:122-1966(+)